MHSRTRVIIGIAAAVLVAVTAGVIVWRSQTDDGTPSDIRSVVDARRAELLAIEGVTAVTAVTVNGEDAVQLSLDPDTPVSNVPGSVDGYRVIVVAPDVVPADGDGVEPGWPGTEPGAATTAEPDPGEPTPPALSPLPSDTLVRGVVTEVALSDRQAGAAVWAVLRVEQASGPAGDKVMVSLTGTTALYRVVGGERRTLSPSEVDRDDVGTHVEIEITGPVLESYPTQATAAVVVFLGE